MTKKHIDNNISKAKVSFDIPKELKERFYEAVDRQKKLNPKYTATGLNASMIFSSLKKMLNINLLK
jgi:hypothetical protein